MELQAVCEGRWLVIENIDLAPPDVLASLRPLLEGRPLHLPNRAAAIDPASGFQLIGTVTQSSSGAFLKCASPCILHGSCLGLLTLFQKHPLTAPLLNILRIEGESGLHAAAWVGRLCFPSWESNWTYHAGFCLLRLNVNVATCIFQKVSFCQFCMPLTAT